MNKLFVHTPWAEFADLSKATEYGEFVVGHAHFFLVGLNPTGFDRDQLGRRNGGKKFSEDWQLKARLCPSDETFEVGLGNSSNGIDVWPQVKIFLKRKGGGVEGSVDSWETDLRKNSHISSCSHANSHLRWQIREPVIPRQYHALPSVTSARNSMPLPSSNELVYFEGPSSQNGCLHAPRSEARTRSLAATDLVRRRRRTEYPSLGATSHQLLRDPNIAATLHTVTMCQASIAAASLEARCSVSALLFLVPLWSLSVQHIKF